MKTILKNVFYCDHCNKHMINKGAMSRHERFCTQNPNNWHKCFDYCEHLIKTNVLVKSGDEETPPVYKTVFTCKELNKKLYSFLLEKKAPQYIDPDLERMPLQCDSFRNEEKEYGYSNDLY
jgi:hypothetical protein